MILAALLLGVVLGIAFDRTLDWILLDPTEHRKRLENENAQLRLEASTLRAQLEALESFSSARR